MINKVFIVGRLVWDIETRQTQSGSKLASGRMAFDTGRFVDNNWNAKDNFIDLTGFSHVAERIMPKFSKGQPVLVEGRLEIDERGGGLDGAPRQKYPKIIVSDMKLIGKHQEQPAPTPYQEAPSQYENDDSPVRNTAPANYGGSYYDDEEPAF